MESHICDICHNLYFRDYEAMRQMKYALITFITLFFVPVTIAFILWGFRGFKLSQGDQVR